MEDKRESGWVRSSKDFVSGAAGGVAQVLIGQPFDIVKVRLQTSALYSGSFDCASSIWKSEGFLAFYKGSLLPLLGIGACVSVQFGAFNLAQRYIQTINKSKRLSSNQSTELTYPQIYAAGAFAGIANTPLSCPIEHIRIRLQAKVAKSDAQSTKPPYFKSPFQCISWLYRQGNGISALYRGVSVTLLREAQAYGVWFLTYEFLMRTDSRVRHRTRENIPAPVVAMYGGISGAMLWLSSYPFDLVKSKMQTDGFGSDKLYANMRDCFRKVWKSDGVAGFWKGIAPTLVRAFPVSAGTFTVVELVSRLLS